MARRKPMTIGGRLAAGQGSPRNGVDTKEADVLGR